MRNYYTNLYPYVYSFTPKRHVTIFQFRYASTKHYLYFQNFIRSNDLGLQHFHGDHFILF